MWSGDGQSDCQGWDAASTRRRILRLWTKNAASQESLCGCERDVTLPWCCCGELSLNLGAGVPWTTNCANQRHDVHTQQKDNNVRCINDFGELHTKWTKMTAAAEQSTQRNSKSGTWAIAHMALVTRFPTLPRQKLSSDDGAVTHTRTLLPPFKESHFAHPWPLFIET
ncbi:hypothetical protein VTO42DRAFT_7383 [Malbranchea cinnamomea]